MENIDKNQSAAVEGTPGPVDTDKMEEDRTVAKSMVRTARAALKEKQAEDVLVIDIAQVTTLADYFIITNGENPRHVKALVEITEEWMEKAGFFCKSIEGVPNGGWVLMDYGDIVINIFSRDDRRFYALERIWRDGRVVEEPDLL